MVAVYNHCQQRFYAGVADLGAEDFFKPRDIAYLDRYGIRPIGSEPEKTGRGIPIGNQTSQVFGLFYLNEVDRFVKEKLRVKSVWFAF